MIGLGVYFDFVVMGVSDRELEILNTDAHQLERACGATPGKGCCE